MSRVLPRARLRQAALLLVAAALLGVALLATTANGSTGRTSAIPPRSQLASEIAKLGKITLVVEDVELMSARKKAYDQLNAMFHKKYPNVTIKRISKGYNELIPAEKLLLSGSHAPDVVEINYGYNDQGPLVKGKLIQSLDPYAKAWGWYARQPKHLLDPIRMTPQGTKLGTSNLWGLAATVDMIGLYVNKNNLRKLGMPVPRTAAQFSRVLAKARAAGEVPIMIGDSDKNATLWFWYVSTSMMVPPALLQKFMLGQPGANLTAPQWLAAAKLSRQWVSEGDVPEGFEGLDQGTTAKMFAAGKGIFRPSGTWENGQLVDGLKNGVGFLIPPPAGHPAATVAGPGQPWCIVTKSKNQLAGAAYIDFITSPQAARVFGAVQDLAATRAPVPAKLPPSGKDIYTAYSQLARTKTGLSWSIGTPKSMDYILSGGQELIRGKTSPEAFIKKLNTLYNQDLANQG